MKPRAGDVRLTRRSVYVLPNRTGLLYGVVLLAMLVASINFRLSLGYAMTFLLGSVAVIGLLHTFRNLSALVLSPGRAEPVFAGSHAEFSLILRNPTRTDRYAVMLKAPGMARDEIVDLPAGAERLVTIALPTSQRGRMPLPRLVLRTRYPLGIWRAWAYWYPDLAVLVYPAPESPATALPETTAEGRASGQGGGEDDVAAIRPFRSGDSLRRVAWKAMARTASHDLLVKQMEGGERGDLLLDWRQLPAHLDVEQRISRLTRWVIDADATGARWALYLPGQVLDLDGGSAHRTRCLEALALLKT
jgi:uncharacterized protein (DUF58 family)